MTRQWSVSGDQSRPGVGHWLGVELAERLRGDPALLDFIQDGVLDGLWYWDLEGTREEWLSPGLKALFGYADHEVENSVAGWQSLILPEDIDNAMAAFARHEADPGTPYDEILRYRHRDGRVIWVRCRGMILRDEHGRPVRMLGGHIDVTALKQAELSLEHKAQDMAARIEELRDQEERLERQAEELVTLAETLEEARAHQEELNAQKDRFFSIVAHDLKSPFNPLLGFSELLASEGSKLPPEQVAEYGALLHRAATEAFKLLEDLLEWSRIQLDRVEFDPGAVDLRALVQTNIERYHYAAQAKGVAIRTEGLDQPVLAFTDPRMLDTVLRNLLSNAIKFTSPGDFITFAGGKGADEGEGEGEGQPRRNLTRLSIRDTGVGIPPDVVPTLLNLDTTRSATGTHGETGTGLGLVICRELMTRQGGTISVESTPGQGTVFHLTLPGA